MGRQYDAICKNCGSLAYVQDENGKIYLYD